MMYAVGPSHVNVPSLKSEDGENFLDKCTVTGEAIGRILEHTALEHHVCGIEGPIEHHVCVVSGKSCVDKIRLCVVSGKAYKPKEMATHLVAEHLL